MNKRTEQDNAVETALSPDRLSACSDAQFSLLRNYLLNDSYAFTKVVCGHKDLIPEFHMPLSYLMCGLTRKLVDLCLNEPKCDSYVIRQLRRELRRRKIDWNTSDGFARLDSLLDLVNIRVYRGSFKSSIGSHGGVLFTATRDPNETIWLVSNSDENAWAFCEQIGETVRNNPVYAALFPERMPPGSLKEYVTQRSVTLGGRSISSPQTNIEADGYQTKRISAHFSTFWIDDLVVKENSGPAYMKGVKAFISGLTGFEMATRRIRRVHQGTIWGEDDDNVILTTGNYAEKCLSILIPIEVYDGDRVENILERGTPTNPRLHPVEKIQQIQDKTITDPEEGYLSWRCNYLLDPSSAGGKIFPDSIIRDPARSWEIRKHPSREMDLAGHFLLRRIARDKAGKPLPVDRVEFNPDDDSTWKRYLVDPWTDLDRVLMLDMSWATGGDNWAVTVTGDDHEQVRCQLETASGKDGVDGWIAALLDLAAFWHPRVIGYDANGNQDGVIQNFLKVDKRLRAIAHLFVPVKANQIAKPSRIKNFVAEPLRAYRLLLAPASVDRQHNYAGSVRDEMSRYRGDRHAEDGILDTLSMAQSLHAVKSSSEERERRRRALLARAASISRSIDPYTGVPYAA